MLVIGNPTLPQCSVIVDHVVYALYLHDLGVWQWAAVCSVLLTGGV